MIYGQSGGQPKCLDRAACGQQGNGAVGEETWHAHGRRGLQRAAIEGDPAHDIAEIAVVGHRELATRDRGAAGIGVDAGQREHTRADLDQASANATVGTPVLNDAADCIVRSEPTERQRLRAEIHPPPPDREPITMPLDERPPISTVPPALLISVASSAVLLSLKSTQPVALLVMTALPR